MSDCHNILLCFLLLVPESGIYPVDSGDMAMVFYITVQNQCDSELHVWVKMKQCVEQVENEQYSDTVQLIGGDMGTVPPHDAKNLTLIYPNLYLTNRMGTCSIIINYQDAKKPDKTTQLLKNICFNTTLPRSGHCCDSPDMDPNQNCEPVDCRLKYSGQRSFYNKHAKRCVEVPQCVANLDLPLPDVAYNPISNQCKSLRNAVTKADLVLLENNNYKDCGNEFAYGYFICHNGHICNSTGECICSDGWITSLDDNYEPSLGIYHMCNVAINGWISANKSRIKITALLISIFAITTASKILIIMCILNMCFKWTKSSKMNRSDDGFEKPCICHEIFAITIASKILIIMCILNMCFKWAKSSKADRSDDEFEKPCICHEAAIKESLENAEINSCLDRPKDTSASSSSSTTVRSVPPESETALVQSRDAIRESSDPSDDPQPVQSRQLYVSTSESSGPSNYADGQSKGAADRTTTDNAERQSSEQANNADRDSPTDSKTEGTYAYSEMRTRSPFVVRSPRDSHRTATTTTVDSTTTAEEIHIYVERANAESGTTRPSNSDFSIEFLEEEENVKDKRKSKSRNKGASRQRGSSKSRRNRND